jgi:small GTP-binding protein
MATIGLNFVYKVVTVQDVKVKLQIWDTAGQDKFKTITKSYYRNSQGVLVVFGVDSRDSYYSVCTLSETQRSGWRTSPTPPATRPASSS